MDDTTCRKLLQKLDLELSRLESFSPKVPGPAEVPHPVGFKITNKTNVDEIPEDKIPLVHSMLHMFYHTRNGANLSLKSIEQLHKKVSQKMKSHLKFDRLDE